MPLPFVVVQIPAEDSAAPEVAALVEACTAGLSGGRCELTQNRKLEAVTAVAIVSWRGEKELSALVEVARLREPSEVWRSEELKFKPEDQRRERFRTIGFAIAALFREATPERPNAAPDPAEPTNSSKRRARPTPESPSTPAAPQVPPRHAEVAIAPRNPAHDPSNVHRVEAWISTGVVASYNPELLAWNSGAQLKFAVGASHLPAFVGASGSYAIGQGPSGASLHWSTLGLGLGLRLPLSPGFELRSVAQGLLVNISGSASEAGRTSRESVWVPGAGLDLEFGFRASRRLGVTLGGELQRLTGRVPIREHDQPVGTVGKTSLGVSLTLELRLLGPWGP